MKILKKEILTFIFVIYFFLPVPSSAQFTPSYNYEITSGVNFSSGDFNPLWLIANKNGLASFSNNNGYLRAGFFSEYERNKDLNYKIGIDLAGSYNFTSEFIIQQLFFDFKYKALEVSLGSKEWYSELKNQYLTSGGLTYSGNSRPIPQFRISIPDYVIVPGTHKNLQVKAHIAYGRFTDDNFQKNFTLGKENYSRKVLYHSKALFFRIGNDRFPLSFEGGIEMETQFGGTTYFKNGIIESYPTRFIDYLKVLIPMSGDEYTSGADQVNITGNHLGSWHLSLNYNKKSEWSVRTYYEHFFEDHSQMFWEYGIWKDGLIGIEMKFPQSQFIKSLVYEYLYTKDQTGPFLHDETEKIPDQISGNDNYYNHYSYSGWSHWGMGIGNPLVISPLYNKNGDLNFRSNRIIAHHVGLAGNPFPEIEYRVLLSYAKHWGTYYNPLPNVKYSMNTLLEINYTPEKLKFWSFNLGVGADKSNLIGNNGGCLFTVKYCR